MMEDRPVKNLRNVLLGLIFSMFAFLPIQAQFQNVGSIDFPTSGSAEAQQRFLRGVATLHSFGWLQAIEQFHAAQEIDPDFAMAYWGESLAYNHPLNSQMNAEKPREALRHLGATEAERLAKAPTKREKGFLSAVEILWGEGTIVERKLGYMEAMGKLHEEYPDDPEVSAFYSLSMLSAISSTGDLSKRLNVKAGDIALRLFKDNPSHPGGVHYTIHAFDDPLLAPLALEAAHRFAEIAPAVSHAIHMPTHIFIQHGMWDYVSGNNQRAYDAALNLWNPNEPMGDAVHALDWGQYGDLQLGDYEKAKLWIKRIESMAEGKFLEGNVSDDGGQARVMGAVPLLKSRYIIETEEWAVPTKVTSELSADELLAVALSAYRLGSESALEAASEALKEKWGGDTAPGTTRSPNRTGIIYLQASALLHTFQGRPQQAMAAMDDAIATVESLMPPRGAASPLKPVHELYGEILMDLKHPQESAEMFEASLLRMPNRPRSLLGLARSYVAMGKHQEARDAYQDLTEVWRDREYFTGFQEAKRFLEEDGQIQR
jgi:tetratricopeptide (TPR) repeat protein